MLQTAERADPQDDGKRHYPLHWVSHIMHAYQVIGYRHPNRDMAMHAQMIYRKLVHGLHLTPESQVDMIERLSEDRIANDTVVS